MKTTRLEGLKLHEVSLVSKGANGEMFEIIKSDNSGNPVEILKSLMKNPNTMDGTDQQILKDMNGDMEAYSQYVDEFVPEFVKDLEDDGVDVRKFVDGMVEDRTKISKTDGMVTEDDCDKNCKNCDKKKDCNSEENEVQKSFLGKVTEVVKNIFGDKEDSKIEKDDSENKEDIEGDEEMNAEAIAKALGEALTPVTQAIEKMNERINSIESNVKGEEVKKEAPEKEAEKEAEKEDAGQVIADAIAKALEPVTKSLETVSERINNIEKQERPSARIVEKNDGEKVEKSAPMWSSIQIKR